ncbi:uncharacterized protein BJ171DRAFT_214595 [Polychytrium aggregatum]|uniref:uncharacterized protein n=1 Tax=Polychytrium aggregatum TaxID=110093 RepID=UPI0022FE78D0|nr:uncharacterized protein BJ171DRAFT_214595 [Polychytrium aggregatum]KAI9199482.1 hypothetical protein BJ171DRAFT_214595 [Polychytrium aggregatum]
MRFPLALLGYFSIHKTLIKLRFNRPPRSPANTHIQPPTMQLLNEAPPTVEPDEARMLASTPFLVLPTPCPFEEIEELKAEDRYHLNFRIVERPGATPHTEVCRQIYEFFRSPVPGLMAHQYRPRDPSKLRDLNAIDQDQPSAKDASTGADAPKDNLQDPKRRRTMDSGDLAASSTAAQTPSRTLPHDVYGLLMEYRLRELIVDSADGSSNGDAALAVAADPARPMAAAKDQASVEHTSAADAALRTADPAERPVLSPQSGAQVQNGPGDPTAGTNEDEAHSGSIGYDDDGFKEVYGYKSDFIAWSPHWQLSSLENKSSTIRNEKPDPVQPRRIKRISPWKEDDLIFMIKYDERWSTDLMKMGLTLRNIPEPYIRTSKSTPMTDIKKYVTRKLKLGVFEKIELLCQGQSVQERTLHDLYNRIQDASADDSNDGGSAESAPKGLYYFDNQAPPCLIMSVRAGGV